MSVKIFFLTLIKKFSRSCDFCLIIADRPVIMHANFFFQIVVNHLLQISFKSLQLMVQGQSEGKKE